MMKVNGCTRGSMEFKKKIRESLKQDEEKC